jgi:hypothetical protein
MLSKVIDVVGCGEDAGKNYEESRTIVTPKSTKGH